MEQKMYEPTEKQIKNWSELTTIEMPSDDEFKAIWKKAHHGKEAGWGMGKRDWIIRNLSNSQEYQMGLWQGRVDKANGLAYQKKEEDNAYNLGYYRGYTNYESDAHGWDANTRNRFEEKYLN